MTLKIIKSIESGRYKAYQRIEAPNVILVEGTTDGYVVESLLKKLLVNGRVDAYYQIIALGGSVGRSQIEKLFKLSSANQSIENLAIIIDGDTNPDKAFEQIVESLKRLEGISAPRAPFLYGEGSPRIGVFVTPAHAREDSSLRLETGTLEHLFLLSQGHPTKVEFQNEVLKSFTSHFLQIENDCCTLDLSNSEAKKLTALMLLSRNHLPDLGVYVREGYWDISSSVLDGLMTFLIGLAETDG